MSPQKYRKKPVVIEAAQFDGTKESANNVLAWIGVAGGDARRVHVSDPGRGIVICTLEGDMTAGPGDYVIRGVKGEHYPCRADIFAATYEAVSE